jgi:hypothetical protein
LPYRTIDVVFNNVNVWANLQHPSPTAIFYDLWNPMYWHPFSSANSSELKPISICAKSLRRPPGEDWYGKLSLTVVEMVMKVIQTVRKESNLSCTFQCEKPFQIFIDEAISKRAMLELLPMNQKREPELLELENWRRALYSKIPQGLQIQARTILVNVMNFEELKATLLKKISFLKTRELGAQFFTACAPVRLPNSVISVFVYIGFVYSMTKLESEEQLQKKRQFLTEEPLDFLVDEWIQASDEKGDLENGKDSFMPENIPGNANIIEPQGVKPAKPKYQPNPVSSQPSKPEISEYIQNMVDGRTKFVVRKVEKKILVGKSYVLNHEKSGQQILIPNPSQMRELEAMKAPGLISLEVSRTKKKEVLITDPIKLYQSK